MTPGATDVSSIEAFRRDARRWLDRNVPRTPLPSGDTYEGFTAHRDWERRLFDSRWAVVDWPAEYGGREVSPWHWLAFEDEYYGSGAPSRVNQNGIFLLAPSIFGYGTEEQKRRLLPRIAAAEDVWCQGWSEPGAGSDLAAIRTQARSADGSWYLSGQKTWTTRGAFSTHIFVIARSDPKSTRHHGLSYFLVPLDAEGVTVRGFERLDGDLAFADVFFDEVRVPDGDVLGAVGAGWTVAMSTTASERGRTLRSPARFSASARRLAAEAFDRDADIGPAAARRVTSAWIQAQAYEAFTRHQLARDLVGEAQGVESSLNKLVWSELDLEISTAALGIASNRDMVDPTWLKSFLFALAGPIYAGTNEVQRNIVAQRLLGLPRPRISI